MDKARTYIVFVLAFFGFLEPSFSQHTVLINDSVDLYKIGKELVYLEDPGGKLTLADVQSPAYRSKFIFSKKSVLAFGITNSTFWLKIKAKNTDPTVDRDLLIDEPEVSDVKLFEPSITNKPLFETGFLFPWSSRPVKSTTVTLPVNMRDTLTHTYYLQIHSNRTLILPVDIASEKVILAKEGSKNIGYGIYFGIFAGLFLYNLFLYFGLKDRAYLYYLFSIFSSFLMFASVTGYTLNYIFPNSPGFNRLLIEIGAAGLSISSALFAGTFLYVRQYSKFLQYALYVCMAVACAALIEIALGNLYTVQNILYNLLSIQIFIMLACGIVSRRNGNAFATYYIVAWLGYMIGGLLILVRDQGLLPFNSITTHSAEAGSAMEIVLLSLALSKRYQTYRREKEEATQLALKIQKEANENLEVKVSERTSELEHTMRELKSTQVQLIQAEKMASLGVMTAGVAHEINNPVNYVTAGLASLKQNYEDMSAVLKEALELSPGADNTAAVQRISDITQERDIPVMLPEMDSLFASVNNGAHKISEIVKGLRNFTRLDEGEVKTVNLEDGLDATISMLSDKLGSRIEVHKDYGHIPEVLCLASQVNQVFMNLLYNAVDAIDGKGEIWLKTEKIPGKRVRISIKDSGKGIPDDIKSRIFDPFFTTKDVGKGTGLGLSISYNIIEKHKGTIRFVSFLGKGSEFVIELDEKCRIDE